ncbi:MAG: hypothetical protein U0640_09305 [Phycisphaerales bacterium]
MSFRWSKRGDERERDRWFRAGLVAFGLFACASLRGCSREAPVGGPLEVVAKIGESGSSPGQFGYPRCLDHDDESLWVIDKLARVQRIDPKTGNPLETWRTPKFDNGKPTGVTLWTPRATSGTGKHAFDQPMMFVADTHEHRILVYELKSTSQDKAAGLVDHPPKLLTTFGSYGTGEGQMIYPTDVCIVPSADGGIEKLFVSEYGDNDRISVWVPRVSGRADASGGSPTPSPSQGEGDFEFVYQSSFGTFGDGVSAENVQFSRPQSMTLATLKNSQRVLLVSDACNHRVGVFTLEGGLVRWIRDEAGPSTKPGGFMYPYGLCDLGDGTVMVAEYGNCRLQRIDIETGASLGIFGERGRGAAQLSTPWAITRMNDKVYVLDSGNSRILAIDAPKGRPEPLSASPQIAHSGAAGSSGTGGGN